MRVPCLYRFKPKEFIEEDLWLNDEVVNSKIIEYIPVYDHPHNDIENGQKEIHYHIDTRFKPLDVLKYPDYRLALGIRPLINNFEGIMYLELDQISDVETTTTPIIYIQNSKLKRKCIYKDKCPHRGYNLKNTKAIKGIITCPLHGLQFDEQTKQLIN